MYVNGNITDFQAGVNLLVCFMADPITRKDTVTLMAINTWISSATQEYAL